MLTLVKSIWSKLKDAVKTVIQKVKSIMSEDSAFDLLEHQKKAKTIHSPRDLYVLWNRLCNMYDKGIIGNHELDEMRPIIFDRLSQYSKLEKQFKETSYQKQEANV